MASLETRRAKGSNSEDYSQVIMKTTDTEYLLCTLAKGVTFQQNLDLVLMPQDQVTFFVDGSNTVHLTGYYKISADQVDENGRPLLREGVPPICERNKAEMVTGDNYEKEFSSAENYSDEAESEKQSVCRSQTPVVIVKQEPADEAETELVKEMSGEGSQMSLNDGVQEMPNLRRASSEQGHRHSTGRNSGEKRGHEIDDGFISNHELPLKKVCPSTMPSLVLPSPQPELPAQVAVPVEQSTTLLRKESLELQAGAKLPAKDTTVRVRQELAHSSLHSPTPPPPVSSATFSVQQPQVTPTVPDSQPIQPALLLPMYQTTPTIPSVPSQQSLNFMEMSNLFSHLVNNCDPPSNQLQVLTNQAAILSAVGALTEKVNTMEKTMAKLTEALMKIQGKSLMKMAKAASPIYVNNMDGSVQVGDENGKIVLNKTEVDAAFNVSLTGKDYVLKMMSIAFTAEELAASNYSGGRTICGSEIKHKTSLSDHWKFKAIVANAERNFPGCTDGQMLKVLKDAVNNKCRKVDSKIKHVQL